MAATGRNLVYRSTDEKINSIVAALANAPWKKKDYLIPTSESEHGRMSHGVLESKNF